MPPPPAPQFRIERQYLAPRDDRGVVARVYAQVIAPRQRLPGRTPGLPERSALPDAVGAPDGRRHG